MTIPLLQLRAIKVESAAKISDYIITKQPPKVITQNPAAGTPVIQGMTIEIKVVSYSDVPYGVLDAQAPQPVKGVSMADIENVVENDDRVKAAVKNGVIPPESTDAVLQAFNAGLAGKGLSGTLDAAGANALVKSIADAGFVDI